MKDIVMGRGTCMSVSSGREERRLLQIAKRGEAEGRRRPPKRVLFRFTMTTKCKSQGEPPGSAFGTFLGTN
uniref:Uncharacterized protein n=1 Tax=Panagrellus redivivus TaxID=6233 RepID=A0A7E4VC93_PANRE